VTAAYLSRKTSQYELVESPLNLAEYCSGKDPLEMVDDNEIIREMVERELLDNAPDIRDVTDEELREEVESRGYNMGKPEAPKAAADEGDGAADGPDKTADAGDVSADRAEAKNHEETEGRKEGTDASDSDAAEVTPETLSRDNISRASSKVIGAFLKSKGVKGYGKLSREDRIALAMPYL